MKLQYYIVVNVVIHISYLRSIKQDLRSRLCSLSSLLLGSYLGYPSLAEAMFIASDVHTVRIKLKPIV